MRGQIFSADLIIAVGIFLIMLGFCFLVWNGILVTADLEINREKSYEKSYQIMETFIRSPGIPSNWENYLDEGRIYTIGLAKNDHILDENKVAALIDPKIMTTANVTEDLDLQGFNYTFYVLSSVNEEKAISRWKNIGYTYDKRNTEWDDNPNPFPEAPCCAFPEYNNAPGCNPANDYSLCRYVNEEIPDASFTFYNTSEELIDNRSKHDLLIFENPRMNSITDPWKTELQEWVNNGGTVIATGEDKFLQDLFGISQNGIGTNEGNVIDLGDPPVFLSRYLNSCYNGYGYDGRRYTEGTCTAVDPANPDHVCYNFNGLIVTGGGKYFVVEMNYGQGKAYSFISPYGDVYYSGSCSGEVDENKIVIATKLFRTNLRLSGSHPINATEFATVSQRFAMLDGSPVLLEFYIWR